MIRRDDIRNIAIIAHVDHGKTTLVDVMLRQSGQFRESELKGKCILDSNDQERERGITILAKNIAINYGSTKINIIDTPGHADFGGEVERTLQMADGALVLVDAFEGPMPQTKFVLRKAFANKIRPIVVINKIDRPDARPDEVLNEVFDTFVELGADEHQLDFPYIFASGKGGFASHDAHATSGDIRPLLDLIIEKVPGPEVDPDGPLRMLCTTLDFSEYVGRIAIGRISSGRVKRGQKALLMKAGDAKVAGSIDSVLVFDKLGRTEVQVAEAGDVVAVVGLGSVDIGDTISDVENAGALPRIEVGEPTLNMLFTVNDSPLTGEGDFLTSRHLSERLERELQSNVALKVEPTEERDSFMVSGRGLLHLSVLIESMRREGFELAVGKPEVIIKMMNGVKHEPYEYLVHHPIWVFEPLDTADGQVIGLILQRQHFERLCTALGRDDLLRDRRFETDASLIDNVAELYAEIANQTRKMTSAAFLSLAAEISVPFGKVNSVEEFFDDPQAKASQAYVDFNDPELGVIRHLNYPAVFERSPVTVNRRAPKLGEHTREILPTAEETDDGVPGPIGSNP